MEEMEPLFITEPSGRENVAKAYNRLIAAAGRNPLSLLRAWIYHNLGNAGHVLTWSMMVSAKTRYRAVVIAFEDHLLVQDEMLHDIEKSGKSKWAWTDDFAFKGGFCSIGDRVVVWDDQEYVRFDYDEIVAAFYSKKMIVLRFCWGEYCWDTWDVIIGPDDFKKGKLDAFLNMVEPIYKGKETTYDPALNERYKYLRLTNEWASPQLVGHQHRVKIYDKRHAWIP